MIFWLFMLAFLGFIAGWEARGWKQERTESNQWWKERQPMTATKASKKIKEMLDREDRLRALRYEYPLDSPQRAETERLLKRAQEVRKRLQKKDNK